MPRSRFFKHWGRTRFFLPARRAMRSGRCPMVRHGVVRHWVCPPLRHHAASHGFQKIPFPLQPVLNFNLVKVQLLGFYSWFIASLVAFYFYANLGFQTVIHSIPKVLASFTSFFIVHLQLGITVIVFLHSKHR